MECVGHDVHSWEVKFLCGLKCTLYAKNVLLLNEITAIVELIV